MQFLMMLKGDVADNPPPTPELFAAMEKLTADMVKVGKMVQTGGMQDAGGSSTLSLAGGKVSVTDGPYAESKEQTGGFAIVDVKDRAEAIKLARDFLEIHARIMGPKYKMESEVREMYPVMAFTPKQ